MAIPVPVLVEVVILIFVVRKQGSFLPKGPFLIHSIPSYAMKLIIAGSRSFKDYDLLKRKCDRIIGDNKIEYVLCGMATGADLLGKRYAEEKHIPVRQMPADWNKHGKAAGPIRNEQMAIISDALIAFWDGQSRGTDNMVELAKKHNLKIRVVRYTPQ